MIVAPITDSVKKITYINSITEAVISKEQINQISEKIQQIRNKIVNTSQS